MADDLSGASAELIETLQRLNSSFRATGDALEQSTDTSNQNQRALAAEFEKLGITLKGENTLLNTHAEKIQQRIALEQEVNDQLKNSGKVRQNATDAELEEYKLTQKRNVLYEQELASLGRVLDANGKITKSQIELEGAQKRSIAAIKKEEESRRDNEQALTEFKDMLFRSMPQQGVMIALNYAMDLLKAGVMGAFKAMVATEDALLAGQRGLSVQTAATAAKMSELAKVTAKLGSSLSGMGDNAIAAGVALMFMGGPVRIIIGLFTLLIGGVLKYIGFNKEMEAEAMERNAEMEKKRGEINDKYAEAFRKLGEASIAGADGMTGLKDNLFRMTLTMADLDKYAKVLQDNQKNLALIGGTMVEGVKSFSSTASELIKSSLGKTLENMGIGVEEMMGHTVQFMAYQNKLGLKTTGDVTKATGEYILELDRLAAITGTSRKEQEQARENIIKMNKIQSALIAAESRNDQTEVTRLKKAIEVAAVLAASGNTTDAANYAAYHAAGGKGAMDAGTARIAGMSGGPGGADDLLTKDASTIEILRAFSKQAMDQERRQSETNKIVGPNSTSSDQVYALNMLSKGIAANDLNFDKAKKKDPSLQFDEFLDKQRRVTDSWRINQVELERQNRAAAQKLETDILEKRYDAIAGALQGPADTMWEAAKKILEASMNFLKGSWDKAKEWWDKEDRSVGGAVDRENWKAIKGYVTGKSSQQYDAEELKDVDSKIKVINAMLKNPEEAKKLAEDNLKLAKKEYEQKEKVVAELKKQYDAETNITEKANIRKKQAIADKERNIAGERKSDAEKGVSETSTGVFGYTSMHRSADQGKLKDLESKRAMILTSMARSNADAGAGARTASGGGSYSSSSGQSNKLPYTFAANNEGGETAFNKMDYATREAVMRAAAEYFEKTGKQLTINSSLRSPEKQKEMYEETVKAGRRGEGPEGRVVAKPGTSPHERGKAVDIQNYNDPKAVAAMNNAGLVQNVPNDAVHFQLARAFNGGVFSGPKSGYPVELHGREAVVPLPNFDDTVSVNKQSGSTASQNSISSVMDNNSSSNDFAMMMGDMFSMMENKLDNMIDKLDTGNNYSDKLVKAMI
jgi:hypothetical protein